MGMNSLILGILRRDPYKEILYFPTFSSGKRAQMIRYETLFYFLYNYNISKIMFFLCEDFNWRKSTQQRLHLIVSLREAVSF